jgi:two-component system sensor histidine kinase ChiS
MKIRVPLNVVIIICIVLFLHMNLDAQENALRFTRITDEEGLSQSTVRCILQDRKGFMWFGTQKGLNRYDGYEFKVYRSDTKDPTTVSDYFIMCMYEDSQGNLWIGTKGGGLNKFDPGEERFEHYELGGKIEITAIYEDKSSILWIAPKGGGLQYFDREGKNFHPYLLSEKNSKTSVNDVNTIFEDKEGVLWIGTENGLYKVDRRNQTHSGYFIKKKISAICEDGPGILWIGTTGDGLFQWNFKNGNTTIYKKEDKDPKRRISDNNIQCIYKDDDNVLWVGTRNGLNKIDQKNGRIFFHKSSPYDILSLSDDDIRCISRDDSGIYWFGTGNRGISIYDKKVQKFKYYSNKTVNGLYEDKKGYIWISIFNGGLNRLDRKTGEYTYYLRDKDIQCMKADKYGKIWIGTTNEGLIEFDPDTGKIIAPYKNIGSLGHNYVMVIYESPKGDLWIGTNGGGISKFDRTKRIFTSCNSGLSNYKTRAIFEDNTGVLWVGTYGGGLNRLKPGEKEFSSYPRDNEIGSSLSDDRVKTIYQDSQKRLWIGTEGGGLNHFIDQENKKFLSYGVNEGLPDDTICGILEDKKGNLWMSTNRGISMFNPDTKKFKNYDTKDGLQGNEFSTGAYFKNVESGEMFFGGANGFNSFLPEEIKDDEYVPPVVITDFLINNKPVSLQRVDTRSPLKKSILDTDSLTLSYRDSFFSFDFAALHYINPRKNQYRYKLEGWDKEWFQTDAKNRRATYTNLPAGEYIFKVLGSNKDGVWSEKEASIKLKILPPPWKTWWAYSFYIMAGALFLFLVWAAWSKRFLKRKVDEQTQKLKDAQDQLIQSEKMATIGTLVAGVAHELNNPTAYIKMYSEYFIKAWSDIVPILDQYSQTDNNFKIGGLIYRDSKEDIGKLITGIMDGINRIKNLIEELKNLSRHEEPLKKEAVDLNKVIQSSINLTRHDIGKATNNFSYKLEDDLPVVYANSQRLERVFINLIQNACQALTNNNQGISISTVYDKSNNQILVQVKDEGVGIDEKNLKYITDPFFTTKRETGGIGLGLSISLQIIKEHGGEMHFVSEPGNGMAVKVNLPIKPSSMDEKN